MSKMIFHLSKHDKMFFVGFKVAIKIVICRVQIEKSIFKIVHPVFKIFPEMHFNPMMKSCQIEKM